MRDRTPPVFAFPQNDIARFARALIAAVTAVVIVILTAGYLFFPRLPPWQGETIVSVLAAAVWMAVGLSLAPKRAWAGIALFIPGALAVWFLSRGFVHSISPLVGMTGIIAASISAMVVWCAMTFRRAAAVERTLAVIVPLLPPMALLALPHYGLERQVHDLDGRAIDGYVIYSGERDSSTTYIHTPHVHEPTGNDSTMRATVEWDPGSGGSAPLTLVRITHAAERDSACTTRRTMQHRQIADEVARDFIPKFITALPWHTGRCDVGTLWRVKLGTEY